MSNRTTRLPLAVVALTVFAALSASAAGAREQARSPDGQAQTYPSHVIGAGSAQWDGRARPAVVTVGGELALVPRRRIVNSPQGYPGFAAGAGGSQADARKPQTSPAVGGTRVTPSTPSGNDPDWTAFAAGAGAVALLATGLAAVLLGARRRRAVGLP